MGNIAFFYKIAKSDVFVFLDNVQYTKNWINRNKIKTPEGVQWLTVPIKYKHHQLIKDVEIDNTRDWRRKHLKTFETKYKRAKFFDEVFKIIHELYYDWDWKNLSEFNMHTVVWLSVEMGIVGSNYMDFHNRIEIASTLKAEGHSTELLINITKEFDGDTYLSGHGAEKYQNVSLFAKEGIELVYSDFKHPTYDQPWGEFVPNLSIIDLLFNCGFEGAKEILAGEKK